MSSQYNRVSKHPGKPASRFNYGNMAYGNIAHQHSHGEYANLMHQRNYGNVMPQSRYQSYSNNSIPKYRPTEGHSNSLVSRRNLYCNQQSYSHISDIARAIRKATCESSLFPHGDPMPEDWIDSWDERPECPRLKWIYQDNPSWQPAIENQHGEYSGTELIQVRGDDALATNCNQLNDFYTNIRPQNWQMVSAKDIKDTLVMTNATSDYETDDSHSDSSSVKSGSSADWFPRKFLGALW